MPLKLGVPSTLLAGTVTPGAFTVARDGHVLLAKLVPAAQGQRSRAELVQKLGAAIDAALTLVCPQVQLSSPFDVARSDPEQVEGSCRGPILPQWPPHCGTTIWHASV